MSLSFPEFGPDIYRRNLVRIKRSFFLSHFQITARKLREDVSYSAAKSVGNTILWLMHRVVEDTRTDDQLRAGQEELRLKQVSAYCLSILLKRPKIMPCSVTFTKEVTSPS